MKKPLLALLASLFASTSWALEPGEALPTGLLQQLGAKPEKITVVDFFAEWCESCRKELPLISQLNSRSDASKVEFIGIDTDEDVAAGEAFQAKLRSAGGLNFRVVNDPEQALVGQFKPRGFPALYILYQGKLVKQHLGATANIDALLAQDIAALSAGQTLAAQPSTTQGQ